MVISVVQTFGIFIGSKLHSLDLKEAKFLCESLHQVDDTKRGDLVNASQVRWKNDISYQEKDGKFLCNFSDPSSMMTIWFYENGTWHVD